MEQLDLTLYGFSWSFICSLFFENLSRFRFHWNLTRITGTLYVDIYTFFIISLSQFFLEWDMFRTKVVEKIETHILCSITFFSPSNHAIHGVMQNFVERVRQQMPIWRTRIAYWISNATNTHSKYVILHRFYTATVVVRANAPECVCIVRYLSCSLLQPSERPLEAVLCPVHLIPGFFPRV